MLGRWARLLAAGLLGACLSGCGWGLLYTNVVQPLDLNVRDTPMDAGEGKGDWKTFRYVVRFDWDSSAIADAARAGGITHVHYADMETLSVLFGIWQQRTAIVYGTGPATAATPAP